MADEQYRWLSPETAERLLSGEALGDLGDHAHGQAERLTRTLSALSAVHQNEAGELPGEEAALAAFRSARTAPLVAAAVTHREGATAHEASAHAVRNGAHRGAPAGDTHHVISRRVGDTGSVRWGRPVRWGMAAALAACMLGGVAVAGGAVGVLPSPFEDPRPSPASSVAPEPGEEERPSPEFSGSPEAEDREPGGPGRSSRPGDSPTPREAEARDGQLPLPTLPGPGEDRGTGDSPEQNRTELWRRAVEACRQYKAGTLDAEKLRALEEAAKGASRLERYCDSVLTETGGRSGDPGEDQGGGSGGNEKDGHGNGGGGRPDEDGEPGEGDQESPSPDPSQVATAPAGPIEATAPSGSDAAPDSRASDSPTSESPAPDSTGTPTDGSSETPSGVPSGTPSDGATDGSSDGSAGEPSAAP